MTGVGPGVIYSAGGVVWRRTSSGRASAGVDVLLVHRDRYDDWSLPKGKVHRGEHRIAAAVREVLEETGMRAVPGPRLPTIGYQIPDGETWAEKVVDFWAMRPLFDEGFTAGDEVDERRWLPIGAALEQVTYARDRKVLSALVALAPPWPAPVLLVRHAQAGRRWDGPDAPGGDLARSREPRGERQPEGNPPAAPERDIDRPLTPNGEKRAQALSRVLAAFAPVRAFAAPALRCRQTLEPLAQLIGIPVKIDARFGEDGDPTVAVARLRALAGRHPVVVCSQGRLMSPVLAALNPGAVPDAGGATTGRDDPWHTRKGGGWVITFDGAHGTITDPLP